MIFVIKKKNRSSLKQILTQGFQLNYIRIYNNDKDDDMENN